MKTTVIELVRVLGAPPKPTPKKENKFNIDEIKKWLAEGYLLKDIAKKYGTTANTLREYTSAHGIDGWKLGNSKRNHKRTFGGKQ